MGGTDPTSWLAANQAQANVVADQVQVSVQGAATQAWAAALSALPSDAVAALGLTVKDVALIIADAGGGFIIADSTATASALAALGISAEVGSAAGPYGAAIGAAVGVVVAVATLPQASGSGPVPVSAGEALADAYLVNVGSFPMKGWYMDAKAVAHGAQQGTGFGQYDLNGDYNKVMAFYLATMAPPYLATQAQIGQAYALAANAYARMPPPDLMDAVLAANDTVTQDRSWPLTEPGALSPNTAVTIQGIFAASAMTGAMPQTMVTLCQSLEKAWASGYIGPTDPRIPAMQAIEAYYGTATFGGVNPPGKLGPGWGNLHGLHNLGPGGVQGGATAPSVVTPTTVAVAVPVVAVAGSLIYDFVRKQAMGTAMKRVWQGAKRAVRGRR